MKKKEKIIIFCGYFPPHTGGIERYADKLAEALFNIGNEVVIVTSNDADLTDVEKKEKYKIYRLPIRNLFKSRYPIPHRNKKYWSLIKQIEEEKGNLFVVNTRFHLTSLIGAKIGKKQHKPVFLLDHGTNHFTVNNKVLDFFGHIYEHLLTIYIKRFITNYYGVSKKCNEWLKHFKIKASGVFYNSIDISDGAQKFDDTFSRKYKKDELIITYAGRLIKEKGILNLIQAFEKIKKSYKNVRLVIAGDGNLLDHLKENYKDEKIDILGRLTFNQIMPLYKRTNIFVYPSLYPEGLPTSILEAGLMECAVIATPRGGTEEVIIDDNHGIIIDGTVDSIYKSLKKLIEDKKLREKMALNINKRVKECFGWENVAEEVISELKKIEEVSNERI